MQVTTQQVNKHRVYWFQSGKPSISPKLLLIILRHTDSVLGEYGGYLIFISSMSSIQYGLWEQNRPIREKLKLS